MIRRLFHLIIACICLAGFITPVRGQAVLFDFDNAPIHTSLPISLTAGGITAHFSATGQGYSIQEANVLGFTPQGFSGYVVYPNSVFLSDLLIRFDQTLSDFSIMYAAQELACDDAETMRVTAYKNGSYVGTNTRVATYPGTWPSDTLSCSFAQGFDSVVIHYANHPPTCQDYGVIYMCDNMYVTEMIPSSVDGRSLFSCEVIYPNPARHTATIYFFLSQSENVRISAYDMTGRPVAVVHDGMLTAGEQKLYWNIDNDCIDRGIYFLNMAGAGFSRSYKIVVLK